MSEIFMVVELMCMILSPRWIHDVGEDVGTAIKRGLLMH